MSSASADHSTTGRTRLVVLFGGRSAERDVSRVSASHVVAALDRRRYELDCIEITESGGWQRVAPPAVPTDPGRPEPLPRHGSPVNPVDVLRPHGAGGDTVVLPVLHGPNGEDGTIQGLLEILDVPYVGSGVLGSAASMDKHIARQLLAHAGVPQTEWHAAAEWEATTEWADDVYDDLGPTVFVKPANMGSSVGVSRVTSRPALNDALKLAFEHDERCIVETAVEGREIEIGVLGNEHLRVSVPGEIVAAAEFYDYDDKYTDGAAELIVPARLTDAELDELEELARRTYRTLRAEGLARVDVFLRDDGRGFVVNELNTFPGFTPISMFPRMWMASGMTYPELLDQMIELARSRAARRRRD